jgi:hypothetical protein
MGPKGVEMELEEIDLFGDASGTISDAFGTIPDAFETISDAFETIPDAFETIADAFRTIADAFGTIADAFRTIPGGFGTIPDGFGTIPDAFGTISDGIDPILEPEAAPLRGARSMPLTHASSKKGRLIMAESIVISPHTEQAKALVEKIRALRSEIPRFTPEVPGDVRTLSTAASVSESFIESASASLPKSTMLEQAPNAATLRDSFAFAVAFETAVTEANAFARAMSHTVRVAKATAGASALDIYAFAGRLAKRKDGAELVPHVEDMRRKLKRGRRKATSEPAPDASVKVTPKP